MPKNGDKAHNWAERGRLAHSGKPDAGARDAHAPERSRLFRDYTLLLKRKLTQRGFPSVRIREYSGARSRPRRSQTCRLTARVVISRCDLASYFRKPSRAPTRAHFVTTCRRSKTSATTIWSSTTTFSARIRLAVPIGEGITPIGIRFTSRWSSWAGSHRSRGGS